MKDSNGLEYSLNVPFAIENIKLNCFLKQRVKVIGDQHFTSPHNHCDYELKYVVSGTSTQIVDGKTVILSAGDLLVIPPYTYHFQTESSNEDLIKYSIRLSVKQPTAGASAGRIKKYTELSDLLSNVSVIKDKKMELRTFFDIIDAEITEKDYGFFDALQASCQSLLLRIIRMTQRSPSNTWCSDEIKHNGNIKTKLDTFIHRNYMYDVKLDELAKELNVSRRHASRLVMKEYNKSFIEKLTQVRLEQAKYLLAYTDKDLSVISSDCGFSSHSYFAACFKKYEETTPKQYRTRFKAIKNNTI